MHKHLINWLSLFHTEGVGPVSFKGYLKEDPYLEDLPTIAKNNLHKTKNLVAIDLNWLQQKDCHIILLCDADYPRSLKGIAVPPPLLFVHGNKDLLQDPQIAIVGSRKSSKLGEKIANNFAIELAKRKLIITSGLALGIDTASHKGAILGSNDSTIAVLGNGLNEIYPKQNINLAADIVLNGGAIVSEFPLHTPPLSINFPRRNRVISGLSLATIVIEASINSGSLITANYALEQGREVFAVPGCIYDSNVRGCHKLIKQGAKLVEDVSDIIEDLSFFNDDNKFIDNKYDFINLNHLDENQNKILNQISYQPTSVDLIIARSGLMANMVNATLVSLELSGYITSVPGGYTKLI